MKITFIITYTAVGVFFAAIELTRQGHFETAINMFWIASLFLALRVSYERL